MIFVVGHFVIVASVGLIALSAVKRWSKEKATRHLVVMAGALVQLIGVVCLEIAPYCSPSFTAAGSAPIAIQMSVFDIVGRVLIPIGLLLFSAGYAFEAFGRPYEKSA